MPLLVLLRNTRAPYSIRLQIWDHDARFRGIEIVEMLAEYRDGSSERRTERWARDFVPYSRTVPESLKLVEAIPGLVTRHESVRVTFVGHLRHPDGSTSSFRAVAAFEPESETHVSSLIDHFGSV